MDAFLHGLGWYNLLGSLLLLAMVRPRLADLVFTRLTENGRVPHDAGPFGAVWLWWAGATNLFLGVVLVRAVDWPAAIQREVALGAIAVYALMEVGLIAAHVRRRMPLGRGVWVTHGLWLGQLGWAVAALMPV
jgi:hypothetical protein